MRFMLPVRYSALNSIVLVGLLSLTTLTMMSFSPAQSDGQVKMTPVSQLINEVNSTKPVDAVLRKEPTKAKSQAESQQVLQPESAEVTPVTEQPTKHTPVKVLESDVVDLPPLNPSPSNVEELSKESELPPEKTPALPLSDADSKTEVEKAKKVLPPLQTIQTDDTVPSQAPEQQTKKAKKNKKIKKAKETVVYRDLPAIAVFPVLRHGNEKAFGDVAIVFANEFANKLEKKFPQTRIHNPVYSTEQLRVRGLGRIYEQMMDYYIKAGRPEPRALKYLLDELADDDGQEIARAVFVEADIDLHHQHRSYRPKDMFKKLYMDALPNEQRYYVNSRVKVYDTSTPHHPLIWSTTWNHPVKTTGLYNVTASVYQDSDSLSAFSYASRIMSRIVVGSSPKKAYRKGTVEIDTSVAGKIYNKTSSSHPDPINPAERDNDNGASTSTKAVNHLSDADRQAIQRLLRKPSY